MFLKHLSLLNYKNFETADFEFHQTFNCLVGQNGIGKTNVLDAIYHLSMGKSYFNPLSTQNVRHGEEFFVIDGEFEKAEKNERIVCSFKKGSKKIIKRNGKPYEKFSEHLGLLPVVIISPADRDLILEGSETRRKFIDGVISQSDKKYLNDLISYNKVLVQRNSLLKYFAANQTFDQDTLGIYNQQLNEFGLRIFESRNRFLQEFIPIFEEQYELISNKSEITKVSYQSKLQATPLIQLLEDSIDKDRALQYTSVGIHKDDLAFTIEGHPIKKFGSQGQQKSFLIALKLAQFHFVSKESKTTPILLLDDIFDKLDEKRVAQLIALVNNERFGQIFISDTHSTRTENVVKNSNQNYKIFTL
ncbi:DNA replication/repair protein RecF [Croceivirga thetidis]|uniref:DNA replication and repair protein RecF n=1 Tax=Croceivirga thetidis TaxID=2721623 RepID=A0ABX1GSA4_9FLAO|nr:DNA replication/repair protein RecF [Croceivirga thetidis]NKI32827.1 DNA replication/repair protein RecF [Croceivirga thetidis]